MIHELTSLVEEHIVEELLIDYSSKDINKFTKYNCIISSTLEQMIETLSEEIENRIDEIQSSMEEEENEEFTDEEEEYDD